MRFNMRYVISSALTYIPKKGFVGFYTDKLVRINPRITKEFYIKSIKTGKNILFTRFQTCFETKDSYWYKSKELQITCELKKPVFNK